MPTAERRIARLAGELGLPMRERNRDGIRKFALNRFEELVAETPLSAESPRDLKRLVAGKLNVSVERLESNAQIDRLADRYVDAYPKLPKVLRTEFVQSDTEGLLLDRPVPDDRYRRYLAVVDARGPKVFRAYFSEWHELTHLLVWPEQLTFDGFRRTPPREEVRKDPIESLVDSIAGELAFYGPLFRPIVDHALEEGGLNFAAIEEVQRTFAPSASFYGTARATVLAVDQPACFVRAEERLKKAEERRLRSTQGELGLNDERVRAEPKLRLVDFWANDAALEGPLRIHQHIRVPGQSVIHEVHGAPQSTMRKQQEDQAWWGTEKKGKYPPLPICVEATRRGEWVYGLITLPGTE